MTLLLMFLACGDQKQAEDSAVEETQQQEDTGGEA